MIPPEVSKFAQKLAAKANDMESKATSAALSAVNTEKSWLRQNWRQLVGFVVAIAIVVYIVHKL